MSKQIVKLMQGNEACVEGALYAGMKFYAGYPITPSTEIAEISAQKLPMYGGKFIQMEDEIGGIAAAIGGSIAGLKSMTATSGPGFSLKQENLGYAAIAEIPLVIVNVQRGGPSTGLPTAPSQGDIMQAKWGTHGDHPVIAVSPCSVKETFTETVRAFNMAEKYRTPVILLTDEVVGHMRERIEVPAKGEIELYDRMVPEKDDENYLPYKVEEGEIVGRMAPFGTGHRYHITGLFHDETGFPSNSTANAEKVINHLMSKISDNLDDIVKYEEYMLDDADFAIIAYGSTARSARNAVNKLRKDGIKVGLFRPITIWPFPEQQIIELAAKSKWLMVTEMNLGQILEEVKSLIKDETPIHFLGKANGEVIAPIELYNKVKELL